MGVDIEGKRIAVLGAGKMGGILLKALLDKGLLRPELACATVAHEERARSLSEKLGIAVGTDNVAAVRNADIILIGLKPQMVEEVANQIQPVVTSGQLFISVAASVPTGHIERALGHDVAVIWRCRTRRACWALASRRFAGASSPLPNIWTRPALCLQLEEERSRSTRSIWTP